MFLKSSSIFSLAIIFSIFSQFVFASNGVDTRKSNSLTQEYAALAKENKTLYVTPDVAFEQVHFWYSRNLKNAEKKRFAPALQKLIGSLIEESEKSLKLEENPRVKEILQKNLEYLFVGEKLIGDKQRDLSNAADKVNAELQLIEEAKGLSLSPTMGYQEDYSQYKPRGHYTQDAEMTKYFKLAMWLGRIGFYTEPNPVAQIDENSAKTLASQSLFLALAISKNPNIIRQLTDIENSHRLWLGESDDLSFLEVIETIKKSTGNFEKNSYSQVLAESEKIRRELNQKSRRLQISSGIQAEAGKPTLSIRLLGQRFMFDSFVFNRLTFGSVKDYTGKNENVWTMSVTPQGRNVRGVPTVFDLMSVYGSDASLQISKSTGNTDYQGYIESLQELKKIKPDAKDSFINHYSLAIRKTLEINDELPLFKIKSSIEYTNQSQLFGLNSAIGAYILLRHDLVAYAKQSYTSVPRSLGLDTSESIKRALIIANTPETFGSLKNAVESLNNKVSSDSAELSKQSEYLISFLEFCEKNAGKAVINENKTEAFWKVIYDSTELREKSIVVTDLHTDLISNQVAQLGIGFPKSINFQKDSKNKPIIGVVFRTYEFKQPIDNRLTDENWLEDLNNMKEENGRITDIFFHSFLLPGT